MDELEQSLLEGQPAPTVIGEHEFALDTELEWAHDQQFTLWRWLCSCGERGNWQSVSGDVAERAWREHVERSGQ